MLRKYKELEGTDLDNNVLFTDFLKQWLENLKPSIELVTYDIYRLMIYNQIIPFFEPRKIKVREIKPEHIQDYINFKLETMFPNTVRKHLWNISKCLESGVRQNILLFNPVKRIDLPKKVRYTGAKYYDEKEIERLLEAIKGDLVETAIILALFYGFRRSEIIGLK